MARANRDDLPLDSPKGLRTSFVPRFTSGGPGSSDRMGRMSETFARAMGTPWFLVGLSLLCVAWLAYNVLAPVQWRFDSAANGFTALTLILSLQASYAAPLILLAQNRQDDRDRVQIVQDRQRAERNLNDTEYLAREVVALRLAMKDMATKDFIRAELRSLLAELDEQHRDDNEKTDEVTAE
ncbi:DUF1003 domain-containing protein [Parafrigoribacterium soli]|uniref:DUF1003 domain-containing protein n=1 Tax=Parafrigoribacterium soli TaxID=3144663 RepID=UPI0032EAADD2